MRTAAAQARMDNPRLTAPGVIQKLKDVLGLDPAADPQAVLDAVTALVAKRRKKGKDAEEKENTEEKEKDAED